LIPEEMADEKQVGIVIVAAMPPAISLSIAVIPRHRAAMNPKSRDSGFAQMRAPE
jgi:hypothetical protein